MLSLAQRYRVPIVEDATYRDLYFNEAPPPSLRELDDHNLVIYLNTFSKVMAPGLRLGWIAAAPSIVEQIAIIKQRLDPHTPNLVQMAVARMLRQGTFDAHLRTLRTEHARRCTQMIATIQRHMPPGSSASRGPREGCTVVPAGPGLSATALHERALAVGRHLRARAGVLSRSRGGFGAAPLLHERAADDGGREHQAPRALCRGGAPHGVKPRRRVAGSKDPAYIYLDYAQRSQSDVGRVFRPGTTAIECRPGLQTRHRRSDVGRVFRPGTPAIRYCICRVFRPGMTAG